MVVLVPFVSVTGKLTKALLQFTQSVWNARTQRGLRCQATFAFTDCGRIFFTDALYVKVEAVPAPSAANKALASPEAKPFVTITVCDFQATPRSTFFVGSNIAPALVFQPVP